MNRFLPLQRSLRTWQGWKIVRTVAIILAAAAVIIGAVYAVVAYGYPKVWTGFSGKTLWDWLSLLGVPVMLALATAGFGVIQDRNRQKSEQTERDFAAERTRESALQAYLNEIGQLIREDDLGAVAPEIEESTAKARRERIQALAQAKTNTILAVLKNDSPRRIAAVEFLGRASLIVGHGIRMNDTDMSGVNLAGASLHQAYLLKTNLQDANLSGANLQGAFLGWSNLQGADLQETDLTKAILMNANLHRVVLMKAKLQEATLMHANLQEANLMFADLRGSGMSGAKLDGAVLIGVDLRGQNLGAIDLQGVNLSFAHFQGADMGHALLQTANLSHADLQGTNLVGANLLWADMTEANFDETTVLPDGSRWTSATDVTRFSDPNHPTAWYPSEDEFSETDY